MSAKKITIIGCGEIAQAHLKTLSRIMPSSDIYLCDSNRGKAGKLTAKWDSKERHTSLDDLLSSEKPDTAHILTPPTTHASLAEKAILAGCHVFIKNSRRPWA